MGVVVVSCFHQPTPFVPFAAKPASTFEELLEPLGLVDKYFADFSNSGIPFEVWPTAQKLLCNCGEN